MIHKFDGSMSSKIRVQKTFVHEKTDRVPINYLTNPAIHAKLESGHLPILMISIMKVRWIIA